MPLDPKAVEMLAARAAVLPRTGTVPAQVGRQEAAGQAQREALRGP